MATIGGEGGNLITSNVLIEGGVDQRGRGGVDTVVGIMYEE